MGVVKILQNSANFSAIDYNYDRVKANEAEVLCKRNFNSPGINSLFGNSISDEREACKRFLSQWGGTNRRIKHKQFHVAISVKGRTVSKEGLKTIAEAWLKRMGYGDNPYIVFFHKNTGNNHIHIVTSRVDRFGRKINDGFEKVRAVKALEEIMGIDRLKDLQAKVEGFLNYRFDNKNQLFSLLESEGMKVRKAKNSFSYSVFKNGQYVCSISDDEIEKAIARGSGESKDINFLQMRALFIKYAKAARSYNEFNMMLKKKHGLIAVMYGKADSHYGYNIIDHRNKCVYKGGAVLGVKLLDKLIREEKFKGDTLLIVNDVLANNRKANTREINQHLRNFGYRIKDGFIIDKATGVIDQELSQEIKEKIKYNDKLSRCMNTYHPVSPAECKWVAQRFHLDVSDMDSFIENNREKRKSYIDSYSSIFSSCIMDGTLEEYLEANEIRWVNDGDDILFVDTMNKKVFSAESLNLEVQDSLSVGGNNDLPFRTVAGNMEYGSEGSGFAEFLKHAYPVFHGGGGGSTDDKKKKKKR